MALTRVRGKLILTTADTCGTGLDWLRPGLEAAGILIDFPLIRQTPTDTRRIAPTND